MSNRLDCIYGLIPSNSVGVADIGTDHGIIPVRLAESDYHGNIIASDLRIDPLNKAVQYSESRGVKNRIRFILCDGLSGIDKELIDHIIIAGMGGDTITKILDEEYWCADKRYSLILQPMTHSNILRYWLINNEFIIKNEYLQKDDGKIYTVMYVVYGNSEKYSDAELYLGKYDQLKDNELFPEYLDHLIHRFSIRVKGQEKSNIPLFDYNLNKSILDELLVYKERLLKVETFVIEVRP